jgi:hypothetical protein
MDLTCWRVGVRQGLMWCFNACNHSVLISELGIICRLPTLVDSGDVSSLSLGTASFM